MSEHDMYWFVNREKELALLKAYYEQCLNNVNCSVLLYGWRRIGKTVLMERFIEIENGILINCAWISDPRTFLAHVLKVVQEKFGMMSLLEKYEKALLKEKDLMLILRSTFELLNELSMELERKLVVALDEFHLLVEKLAYRISRETRKSKEIVKSDILWLMREIMESRKVFWILSTSMGWAKIYEEFFSEKKMEKPLLGVVVKMRLDPLDENASIELCKKLNTEIDDEIAREIYRISKGVPRIIELIAPNYRKNMSVLKLALSLIREGQFDEFFENIIKFVAEASKRDFSVLIEVMKTISDGWKTPDEIASILRRDRVSIYNILEELRKMELVEKEKRGKRVFYTLKYPLLKHWLELRIGSRKSIIEIIASEMGILAESYIKELLNEYMINKKPIELYDDKKGRYLAGTSQKISIKIKKIYSREEMRQRLQKIKNADLIILDEDDNEWMIEIKSTLSNITRDEIIKLINTASKLGIENKILIQLGHGEIELSAVAEAVKGGVIIITREGIKLLAKKVHMPQF